MSVSPASRERYQQEMLLILLRLQIIVVALSIVSNVLRLIWEPPLRGLVQTTIHSIVIIGSWGAIHLIRKGQLRSGANVYLGLVIVLAGVNIVTSHATLLLIGMVMLAMACIVAGLLEPLVVAWHWGVLYALSYVGLLLVRNQIHDFALDLERSYLISLYIFPPIVVMVYLYLGQRIGKLISDSFEDQRKVALKNADLYSTAAQEIAERVTFESRLRDQEQSSREFQSHLKTLHRMTLELSELERLDDIYRRGVEYGLNDFGFDRLGLFRMDETGEKLLGTYGTDPDGKLRDERDYTTLVRDDPAKFWDDVVRSKDQVAFWEDAELLDYAHGIGRGWHARAVLWDGTKMTGIVVVDNFVNRRPPRSYEIELISLYSATMAFAISRKEAELSLRQSEQTSREFQRHLKMLHQMTLELGELETLDDIYRRGVEYGLNEFDLDRVAIFRLDETKQIMTATYGTDQHGNLRAEFDYITGIREGSPPHFDEVLAHKDKVMIVENIDLYDYDNMVGNGWHARTVLLDGTEPIGIVVVDNLIHQRPPRPYELDLLSTYTSTLAHAISRKEAELSVLRQEQSSREFQEHLKVLHRMTLELSEFDELDNIYRRGVEYGLNEFGFDRLGLFRLDKSGQTMLGTYGTGPDGNIRDERQFRSRLDEGPRLFWDEVVKSKDQVALWVDVDLVDYNQKVGTGWNAMAALWDGATVIGILAVDNFVNRHRPRPYEQELISLYSGTLAHLIRIQEAKNILRHNEQSAREFQDHLRTLHRMTIELGQLDNIDDIFKRGVEYGLHEFGIDRIGLFLIDHEKEELIGKFGTAPDGSIRDERDFRTRIRGRAEQFLHDVEVDKDQVTIWEDVDLIDYDQVVGKGWNGLSALWSGNQIIGIVAFDNFVNKRGLRPYEHDLLRLYSSVFSHLVTRRRAEQTRLDFAMERERVKVLQQFLAAASHDLRTPLSVVQMNAHLLRSVEDEKQREYYLDVVDNQVERLKTLIEDMLAMSHLDSTSEFEYEWTDLANLTLNIIDQQGPLIARKSHNVMFDLVGSVAPIYVDRVHIGQAISNVLINALHYTPSAGKIWVKVYQDGDAAIISIKDSGVGISDKHLPRIFERFYRTDLARSTETGGSGLGLSIAQKIVEGHQGKIEVESEVGNGSTFKIILPYHDSAHTT